MNPAEEAEGGGAAKKFLRSLAISKRPPEMWPTKRSVGRGGASSEGERARTEPPRGRALRRGLGSAAGYELLRRSTKRGSFAHTSWK